MATRSSILARIVARMKDIIRIAEEAATHAMKMEPPRQAKQGVTDRRGS